MLPWLFDDVLPLEGELNMVVYLFEIDLSRADIEVFDRYEEQSLPVLAEYGGELVLRLRDVERLREWHVVRVPHPTAWEAFRQDPRRVELQWQLTRSRVRVDHYAVAALPSR